MNAQSVKKAYQLTEWANQIQARLESGQTVRDWCEVQSISIKTYYYRLRRVREELLETAGKRNMLDLPNKPKFVPISLLNSRNAAITVRIGGYSADIYGSTDISTVEQVLRIVI